MNYSPLKFLEFLFTFTSMISNCNEKRCIQYWTCMFLLCCFTQDIRIYVLQNGIRWVY
jgi:hypothetical protein